MEAVSKAVKDHIPHSSTSSGNHQIIPGFSEEVQHFKQEASFHHALWVSAGRPQNTDLHNAMKRSRNQQLYAVRRAKLNSDKRKHTEMFMIYFDKHGRLPLDLASSEKKSINFTSQIS